MSFPSISPKQSFPALESEVLAYWKANNTFQKSIDSRPENNPYRFYDGPPFITGMPHYGSLLSSIVKDVVGRYWTMQGRRVDRTWGWDCHGLPIEEKVQKKLGLKSNKEIEENGVKNFIDECYNYTRDVSSEWNWYIDKIGRWVDMDRAYRTMDQDYMESVMWVFSELWKKGLIYEGKRVSLYSWKLGTPISNFEVAMDDTYQDVNDPAITVKFKLEKNEKFPEGTSILAWTTTPWTIPANMALGVGEKIDYVLIEYHKIQPLKKIDEEHPIELLDVSSEYFIVAKNRVDQIFNKPSDSKKIIREFKGSELVGLSYIPPFPEYYKNSEKVQYVHNDLKKLQYGSHILTSDGRNEFIENINTQKWRFSPTHRILPADFATDTDGTGIVHIAPEFGEADFGLAKKYGIPVTEAMDEAGKYTSEIFDYEGTHYLDLENPDAGANKINIERMKANNTLFKLEGITHRIPFCPRSGTPLVQKAQASWFIDIQSQKDKLIEANEQINWFPEYLKEGRFKKGIETAPDWCISRTRYWGAPMPVWMGEDGEKMVVSSREEIFEANKSYGQLTKVILVRHGRTDYNGKKVDVIGKAKLIEDGLIHAENIKQSLGNIPIDAIYSSPLERCLDTITPLAQSKEIPIIMDDRLKELQILSSQEKETSDIDNKAFTYSKIEADDESIDTFLDRTQGFLQKIISENPGKTIVICSHFFTSAALEHCLHNFDWDTEHRKYALGNKIDHKDYLPYKQEFVFSDTCTLFNLHKPYIDSIKLKSPTTGNTLTRIPEVLDVWMDSGSMPYAQMHYPFENKEAMQASFPADFIAEYVGQIRAWFYVMHVLGVLLNPNNNPRPTPSFTNVITTGVVNGNDGRKMSKSFGNYPDPRMAIEKYGADPIRFYMLNSPLLSGGDMDFKEEGIMETIKGVMLPIWNTYSFFTTYANIDNWEVDTTEVWFSRHAETTSNVSGKMSDGSDNPDLTEKGREQAKNAGKNLRDQGKNFDIIIHTSPIRANDTAHTIGKEIGYTGEYIVDDRFIEQSAGEYANMTIDAIRKSGNLPEDASHTEIRKIYKNNSTENIQKFECRIIGAYEEILTKYKGKRILIVAHAGTPRPILHKYMGMNMEQAYYSTNISNADPFRLTTTPIVNPLDNWVLSKLQVLIGQVHDAMEGYDISRGCRAIVDYMDELTNWYVRLSRRRFWEAGMTADKKSAYQTLHTVLSELSKLLAPLMPFLSESIWKGLTDNSPLIKGDVTKGQGDLVSGNSEQNPPSPLSQGGMDMNSVHLQYITRPNRHLIANDLNRDMEICEHIVSLGLTLRSRKNIRVRQPLASITITRELSSYYQTIIRDELNVKEVKFEDPEKLAKKICKPDARKIGPKYGKDVQYIIGQAKAGNFVEGEKGNIFIRHPELVSGSSGKNNKDSEINSEGQSYILELGEYTIEYLPLEGTLDVEGGYGMVVGLDTTITESLKLEGYARDIIRLIQDMRKEADYAVIDRIQLSIAGEGSQLIVEQFGDMISSETLSVFADITSPDIEKNESLDENISLVIRIKKS